MCDYVEGNEPAFPVNKLVEEAPDGEMVIMPSGLSKREYFAGLAMQGFIIQNAMDMEGRSRAERAVIAADALLIQLDKGEEDVE